MLQYQLNMPYTFIILGIKTERKRKRCPALPVFPSRSPRQLRSRIFSYKYRNCHYLYMVELGASFRLPKYALLAIAIILSVVSLPSYATDISACGTLSSSDSYILTQNVSSAGACFAITANDTILDGNGYTINYSLSARGEGINISGHNVTIKNVVIVLGNTSSTGDGILIRGTFNNTINNVTVNLSGDTCFGCGVGQRALTIVAPGSNNTINGSYFYHVSDSSNAMGLGGYNNTLANSTVLMPAGGRTKRAISPGRGTIINNNFINHTSSVVGAVVDTGSSNLIITNNIIESSGPDPVLLLGESSSNGKIIGNIILGRGVSPIRLNRGNTGNEIINNTLISTSSSVYVIGFGCLFGLCSNYNKIYNNVLNSSGSAWSSGNSGTGVSGTWSDWNTTKTAVPNILNGRNLGGNYYVNYTHNGFSETCYDGDMDGICDSPKVFDENNTDYLPLKVPSSIGISFVSPTDGNGTTITDRNFTYVNVSIENATSLDTVGIEWSNGTTPVNVTVFGGGLVGLWDFDNSTIDKSAGGNDGTMVGSVSCLPSIEGKFN